MKKILSLIAMAMMAFSLNAQNAYLLLESSISQLPTENSETEDGTIAENPEINAANWFNEQYVNNNLGSFVSVSEIKDAYAKGVKTIWVNIDRVGLNDIVDAGISDAVIADLKSFVENGGNLLLTKQATMIAHRIGRIYKPSMGRDGYSLGGNTMAINPQLGLWKYIDQVIDCRNHPIYKELTFDDTLFQYQPTEDAQEVGYPTLPLVGAVPRTNNDCIWLDLYRKDPVTPTDYLREVEGVTHYENDNILRLQEFESDWNCKMLACWGHVMDFCSAGIVEMNPDGNFKGRVLGIGFGAYQWGSSNDYISNVKMLTKNSINYLTGEIPQTPDKKTIGEFLELKNKKDTCILTGTVSNIVNSTYGNFDLTDETGSVYVYGLLTAKGESKKFATLGIEEGDKLTIKALYSEFNGKPQIKNGIFVNVEKAAKPVEVKLDEITFGSEDVGKGAWSNGYVYTSTNGLFTVSLVDPESKMSIDLNNTNFGTAEEYTKYTSCLKTGGKSTSTKNFMKVKAIKDGKLYIMARSGSATATDRNIILANGETALLNQTLLESDAIEVKQNDESTTRVYPIYTADLTANVEYTLSYPVNEVKFYAFGFASNETPSAIESITTGSKAVKIVKVIRNGKLLIQKDGRLYNVQGQIMK